MAPRKPKDVEPLSGLYKNGARWWIRSVHAPLSGVTKPLSTGTEDTKRANAIKQMVDDFRDSRPLWPWLDLVVAGELTLDRLYTHHANASLDLLAEQRQAAVQAAADADLGAWVTRWAETDRIHGLPSLNLRPGTRATYARQVLFFIPDDVPFPKSKLTEAYVKTRLDALAARDGGDATGTTRRRYLAGLQQFVQYALRRVPLDSDPLAGAWGRRGWAPKNGKPRMVVYEHKNVMAVLDRMSGEYRAAMALVFGTGIELSALLALKGSDVGSDAERTIVAHGTKNNAREDRTVIVDAWAWRIFAPHARTILPQGRVWSAPPTRPGQQPDWKALREAFYWAQVKAGLIDPPAPVEGTSAVSWAAAQPHRIHDARHSYVVNRSLGLDGEPAQDLDYCVHQLGHTDETMIIRIYKKQNLKQRGARLRLQREQQAAKAAGEK